MNQPNTIRYRLFILCTDTELLFGSVDISLARTEPLKISSQQLAHSISLPGLRTIKVLTCNLSTFVNEAYTVKSKSSTATWGLCHDFTLSRSLIAVWVSVYVRCATVFCSAKLRSFLRVNLTWEVTEGSRSVATVYSQTHLLCILYIYLLLCLLLFITDHQRHLSPVSSSQSRSPQECPPLASSLPKIQNPSLYRTDSIGRNSNSEFPIVRI
jgi:hypothetical protein